MSTIQFDTFSALFESESASPKRSSDEEIDAPLSKRVDCKITLVPVPEATKVATQKAAYLGWSFICEDTRFLNLSDYNLCSIPDNFSLSHSQLIELKLNNCALKVIPKPITELFRLKILELNHNELTNIDALSTLTDLEILDVSENQISCLGDIGTLKSLKSLNISCNPISDFPLGIESLFELEELMASFTKIQDLTRVCRLINLRSLTVSFAEIHSIPVVLKQLKNLRVLDLQGNKIRELPDIFYELFIEKLNVNYNNIRIFPYSLIWAKFEELNLIYQIAADT